jgi:hypothetical protein
MSSFEELQVRAKNKGYGLRPNVDVHVPTGYYEITKNGEEVARLPNLKETEHKLATLPNHVASFEKKKEVKKTDPAKMEAKKMLMDRKYVRLYEVPSEENGAVAFWFESEDGEYVASIVAGVMNKREHDYDVRGRLRTPTGFLPEIGFVGALFNYAKKQKENYMGSIDRSYQRAGFNVKTVGSGDKEWKSVYEPPQ